MRIGLFTDTYPPELNGVANSTRILRDELAKHGHDVFVITTRKGIGLSEWDENHEVLRLAGVELKSLYGYVLTSPIHLNALNEVRKLNLDIIHAQTEFGVGIFARMCAKQLDIPLVSTYHTTYEDYTHYVNFVHADIVDDYAKKAVANISKLYGNTSLAVIAPSQKTKELLESYHVDTNIHVIPTGLDLEIFHPSQEDTHKTRAIRNEYGIGVDEKCIIYVGRIAEEKALDLVLKGFAKANAEGHLLIVGGGPDLENLKKLASSLHMKTKIHFAGPRPASEIPDYYRSADAFISASLSETQGMTFIEALASGLPLFARKDEVLEELLIPNKTGWYFEDEDDLATKITEFFQMEDTTSMQEACMAQTEPYRSETFYQKMIVVYEEVVQAYHDNYVVDEIEVKNNHVKLSLLGSDFKEETLLLSLEAYYENGLRKGSKIAKQQLSHLRTMEEEVRAYERALHRISVKDRTEKEMQDWLQKNTECGEESILKIIHTLKEKGYLDDDRYLDSAIEHMRHNLYGKSYIQKELEKKGLEKDKIANRLIALEDQDLAQSYATKILKKITGDSLQLTKKKIVNKLMQRGFEKDLSYTALSSLSMEDVAEQEWDNLKKCACKAKKRYDSKYDGQKLRQAVFQYCYSKGYKSEAINEVLNEMEFTYDED